MKQIKVKENKEMRIEYMTLLQKITEYQDEAREEGIEIGRMKEKLANAKVILDIADDETISKKLDFPIEKVKEIRAETEQ